MKLYNTEAYEKDYLLPYHWTVDSISLFGMQYMGYLRLCVNMISETEVKKVLDVGCGDGKASAELIRKGFEVTGIDFSENAINHCKRLVPKGTFKCANVLEANTFIDFHSYFDAVTLIDVIEHIPPRFHSQLIRNIQESLKQNGIFILSTPSKEYPLPNEQHYKHFTLSDTFQLVEDGGGFRIENIVGNHHLYFLKVRTLYRFIDNRYYDLRFIRRILAKIYEKRFRVAPLEKACRYIIKARKA